MECKDFPSVILLKMLNLVIFNTHVPTTVTKLKFGEYNEIKTEKDKKHKRVSPADGLWGRM